MAKVNAQDVMVGIVQVAFGYLKKVIADNLTLLTLYLDTYQDRFADLLLDQRWFLFTAIAFRMVDCGDVANAQARLPSARTS